MPLRRFIAVSIAAGVVLAGVFVLRNEEPPSHPMEPALPPVAARTSPPAATPVAESQPAVDMVRAAGGTTLIAQNGQVKVINLTGCRIADDDLQFLVGTPDLVLLNLDGTTVTDRGLSHIHGLPQLKILRLCRTSISDAGLPMLADLPSLESLHLDETRITDEGLRQLGDFPSLTSINALGCPVTEQAERIVRERQPDCRVKH